MSENKSGKPLFYDPSERRIRSFVTRAGRVSVAQGRALEELGPRFLVPYDKAPLDLAVAFGRQAPTILEIGFGMGETSAKISALMPEKNFIGVEVHTPAVATTCHQTAHRTNLLDRQPSQFGKLQHPARQGFPSNPKQVTHSACLATTQRILLQ